MAVRFIFIGMGGAARRPGAWDYEMKKAIISR
jgi:hypothetical protein